MLQMDLVASRNATWAPTLAVAYFGDPLPLDGATITMQVRLYGGAAGAPLLSIAATFEDQDVSDIGAPGQRMLLLHPETSAATIAGLPGLNQPEAGAPQVFAHDILITYADGASELLAGGRFTVQPGVTVL